jgi:hypothetical protein
LGRVPTGWGKRNHRQCRCGGCWRGCHALSPGGQPPSGGRSHTSRKPRLERGIFQPVDEARVGQHFTWSHEKASVGARKIPWVMPFLLSSPHYASPQACRRAACSSATPREPGALCRGPGGIAPRGSPGHRLPLVALMPQWRQDYPNYRPPTRATAISAMGHNPTWRPLYSLRQRLRDFAGAFYEELR